MTSLFRTNLELIARKFPTVLLYLLMVRLARMGLSLLLKRLSKETRACSSYSTVLIFCLLCAPGLSNPFSSSRGYSTRSLHAMLALLLLHMTARVSSMSLEDLDIAPTLIVTLSSGYLLSWASIVFFSVPSGDPPPLRLMASQNHKGLVLKAPSAL